MTPSELRDLLIMLLIGAAGGTETKWKRAVGEVEKLPITRHPKCNWRIEPRGTKAEREAVERATEIVRVAHPYVS